MIDREKVIKGLESIVNDDWMWKKADYYAGVCKDALALLKEQEPRVMTLEELDALGDDDAVWLECLYTVDGTNKTTMKPAIYQPDNSSPDEDGYYCVVSSWGKSGFYHEDNYMGDWRCWTSRPTEAQREEIPWE